MLDKIREFSDLADKSGIKFCHFKSNATLGRAVTAKTDLDILFLEKDKEKITDLFRALKAIRFEAVKHKRYDKIDDFLAVDEASLSLIHFHVHYQLDIGEKNVKNYRLPFSEEIVDSRVKHPEIDFWTSSPEHELILLVLRQTLRVPEHTFRVKKLPKICKNAGKEHEWLKKRAVREKVESICDAWFPEDIASKICEVAFKEMTVKNIHGLGRVLRPHAEKYRTYEKSIFHDIKREYAMEKAKRSSKMGIPVPGKRTFPNRGLMIVFVGSDGSGKSSLADFVAGFFSKKIDVLKVYFGHGRSNKSLLLTLTGGIDRALRKTFKLISLKTELPRIIKYSGVTLSKKQMFKKAEKARAKGMLVVCDRFPQTDHDNINDGLRMNEYKISRNPILKHLSKWERNTYELRESVVPDIVFKILVDPGLAFERKGGSTKIENVRRKNEIVRMMKIPEGAKTIEIMNAGISLEELKGAVLRHIWRHIEDTNFLKGKNTEE